MYVHDVLIIGAGPAGLAAAARLREHTPSATFTDDEHQRYHWIKKHGRKMNIKNYKSSKDSLRATMSGPGSLECGCLSGVSDGAFDMRILDADGAQWMAKWNRLFKTFGIDYLRSPMFFQVDPADRDALLAYAYEKKRENELQALPGCAGKEISKHKKKKRINSKGRFLGRTPDVDERDRKDYFVPSTALFSSQCDEIIQRYGLGKDLLRQEKVMNIEYDTTDSFKDVEHDSVISNDGLDEQRKVFRVSTDQGIRFAHVVILAIGPGNAPCIPPVPGLSTSCPHEGFAHAMQVKEFPPSHVKAKINARRFTNIIIIGGGLTSIQLADLAIKRRVGKVWLLMRGDLKVKYFDVDLDWVGKFRNFRQAEFYSADTHEERFDMINRARNGGSITPRYRKILDAHVANGKISLHTHTTLESVTWDTQSRTWNAISSELSLSLPSIDYIVFATGIQSNIHTIPFLQTIQHQYPIETISGLPCINDDLMWNDDVPLFVTGRLAGLRLGPGAPNLVGARIGAERISWNVEDVLKNLGRVDREGLNVEKENGGEQMEEYATARGNRFESLVGVEDEG